MPLIETSWWMLCIVFGLMLLLTLIMRMLSHYFYTKDVVVKKFSIMDLEAPATAVELVNLIKGLYKLEQPKSRKAVRAVRAQLLLDFIYMPCAYGSVFIVCMLVATKMQTFGVDIFIALAWLQIIPWLCDIIENIYLLSKIKPNPPTSTKTTHSLFLRMQAVKWGIALLGAVCSIAAIAYFWLSHNYSPQVLHYALIIIGEIILFLVLARIFAGKKIGEMSS